MIDVENILIGMPQIINLSSILSVIVTGNIELSYFLIYNFQYNFEHSHQYLDLS